MSAHFNITRDKSPEVNHWTVLEKGLYTLLQRNFLNYKEFQVISNLKKYKPSEDAFIYGQKIGRIPEICEVYLLGNYICEISIYDRPEQALVKIQDGLIDHLKEKKFVEKRKKGGS